VSDDHAEEIARQLTIIEYNLYKTIKPWEFFNQSWTKKDKEILSPNILNMIKRFNKVCIQVFQFVTCVFQVSNWVATEIVKGENLKARVGVLAKFVEIAEVIYCSGVINFD
jgi:son of sevenless-like protein